MLGRHSMHWTDLQNSEGLTSCRYGCTHKKYRGYMSVSDSGSRLYVGLLDRESVTSLTSRHYELDEGGNLSEEDAAAAAAYLAGILETVDTIAVKEGEQSPYVNVEELTPEELEIFNKRGRK